MRLGLYFLHAWVLSGGNLPPSYGLFPEDPITIWIGRKLLWYSSDNVLNSTMLY